jgi:hypothetical protein
VGFLYLYLYIVFSIRVVRQNYNSGHAIIKTEMEIKTPAKKFNRIIFNNAKDMQNSPSARHQGM